MRAGRYDIATQKVRCLRCFFRKKSVAISDISKIEIRHFLSLCDEIGVIVYSEKESFFIRETTGNFWALLEKLDLPERLDKDWYSRTEKGEVFEIIFQPDFDFKFD